MYIKPTNKDSINKYNVHDKVVDKFDSSIIVDTSDYITISGDNSAGTKTIYKYACTKINTTLKPSTQYYLVVEIIGKENNFTSISFVDNSNTSQFKTSVSSFATSVELKTEIVPITTKDSFDKSTTMLGTYVSFGAGTSGSITFRISVLEEEPTLDTFTYLPYGVSQPNEDNYEITSEIREAYKSSGSVKRGKIELVPLNKDEDTIVFDESDLKDFTILDDIYTPEQGIVGSVIAKQLTLNLFKPSIIDLVNREIDVFVGVMVGEIPKYVPYGRYIIQKPENEVLTEKTSFEAFDFMVKFNLPFEDTLIYPCKVKDVYNAICEQCEVESGTDSFTNEDFIVENNQFVAGESCRDVLKAIAQISGTFAKIGRDNKLYLSFVKNDSEENFDTSDYNRDIKINNMYGPVNRLVIRMSQVEGENVVVEDEVAIERDGLKELVISDNPFMYTQEKREQAKDNIWKIVKGLTYYDYEMKVIPRPFLDSGTNITIKDLENNIINTYLFSHEIYFNGGLSGNMSATADTETETKYAFVPELSNRLLHTEIMVDKANQEIIVIAEKNEENREQIVQQKTTIESITNSVSDSKTAIDEITGNLTTIEKSINTLEQTVNGVENTLETQRWK